MLALSVYGMPDGMKIGVLPVDYAGVRQAERLFLGSEDVSLYLIY